jgi:Anti-sigma-K factor rskA
VSHIDPAILALRALGEPTGTSHDDHHVAQCTDCQRELERLTRVVDLARMDEPLSLEQPPPGVWEQIAAAVGEDVATAAPAASVARTGAGRVRRVQRKHQRLTVALAGLAAGLIIGIGGAVGVAQLTSAPTSQVVAQIELRSLPQFPQWQGASGTALLRNNGAAKLLAVSVTAPQRAGFYEVWLLGRDGTSMISLGDLNAAHTGTFALPAGVDLGFYSRIDVSLQPFNGSTVHSGTSVVRGSLPTAAVGAGSRA